MQDVIKKLRFKDHGVVLNAPPGLESELVQHGFQTGFEKNTRSKNTLVFINNYKECKDFLQNHLKDVETDSILWLAYPKGTSGIKTDINRDSLRVAGEEFGITTVTAISIDNIWSALRFRPIDRVGK